MGSRTWIRGCHILYLIGDIEIPIPLDPGLRESEISKYITKEVLLCPMKQQVQQFINPKVKLIWIIASQRNELTPGNAKCT